MIKLKSNYWLILNYFGYFCAYGVFVPLIPVWLQSQSYSDENIALLLASAYIFRFLGGIFFSGKIKDTAYLPAMLRNLAFASALVILMISISSWYWHSFLLIFVLFALFSLFNGAGMPLQDSLAGIWNRQIGLDYGRVRLIGSLGFVIGVVVFGALISYLGDPAIIWVILALLVVYILYQLPTPATLPISNPQATQAESISYRQLLSEANTRRLLIAISLIQGSHGAYYAYSTLYWISQGIDLKTTSLLWGISVVAEVILFFFASKLFKHWNITALFTLSIIAATLRWAAFPLLDNLALLTLLQLFHALTYAVSHFATVRYISAQPDSHIAKLQALYNGISNCIAVALLTALSGVIYSYNPTFAFWTMAAFALSALLFLPKTNCGKVTEIRG
ncbi:MFS transporter [Gallibacterium anatis]|uniref:MFS transporter n=1 Tax=Gallibacterium anatis TaxID=750 RepID=A0A0A2XPD3_9PAST|nr:3-phenylpropionate MFS transporter [Gallibacterium anatis]KGQ32842.1 MFS transporter [Gallibacterium anatis]